MTGTEEQASRNAMRSRSRGHCAAQNARVLKRLRRSVLLTLCALILVVFVGGCNESPIVLPHQKSAVALQSQRLAAAKSALASSMADVEACELAVLRGTSIDELSYLSARARASTSAFAKTADSRLLPQSTNAVRRASRCYSDSCDAWRADVQAEQDALHRGLRIGPGAVLLGPMRTERHHQLWVDGAVNLGKARMALKDGPP